MSDVNRAADAVGDTGSEADAGHGTRENGRTEAGADAVGGPGTGAGPARSGTGSRSPSGTDGARSGAGAGSSAGSAGGSAAAEIGGWTRAMTARPRLTVLLALLFVAVSVVAGSGVADRLGSGGYEDPKAQSAIASAELDDHFPGARPNLLLMVGAETGVDAPGAAAAGRDLASRLSREESVVGVVSYWDTKSPGLLAKDGKQALIAARITGEDGRAAAVLDRLAPRFRGSHGPVEVTIGGPVAVKHDLQEIVEEDLLRAEAIALPVTLVLLIMVFGSAVAALLPLGIGVISILGTNAVLRGLTSFTDVSVFALNLTTALGLGLAIDYALFIVRRFREELPLSRSPRDAVGTTLRTAGRTVLFSALTVAVSLSAMLVFPQYFLRSFAYAGMAVVLLAAAAALIVLPAVLVLLGDRVNALDVRRLFRRRAASRAASAVSPSGVGSTVPFTSAGSPAPSASVSGSPSTAVRGTEGGRSTQGQDGGWGRLARTVMRRAPAFAIVTALVLVALGVPFLDVQFGSADDRQLPASAESHIVQQDIRENFPGSPGDAIDVLAKGWTASSGPEMADYAKRLSALPGVLRVDSPAGGFADGRLTAEPGSAESARVVSQGGVAHLTVLPEDDGFDAAGQKLVGEIRAVDAPFDAAVSGAPAVLVDTKSTMGDRLPLAGAIIAVTTLVLVFLLTGSILIPVQAVVLNALSLSAMFGAVVWVFQDGHLSGVLGFTAIGSIETTLPVLMFCVAFGLSMDYGVFLLSRIKEEYDRTGDHQGAVVYGVQRTGGLITAAAVILAVVLAAIGTSRVTNSKMLGLGVALAVLMDAMVVRGLLVPAVMRLTGKATWWAPGPLRRLHERFGLSEGRGTGSPAPRKDSGLPAGRGTEGGAGSGLGDDHGPGPGTEPDSRHRLTRSR